MDTSEDERQQKRGKWVLTRHTMPMQQSIRDTWDERHRGQWGATKSLRRRTMKRQTITQWRWWWGMTTVTRNDERQGQWMMGKTYLMCNKEKDNEGDMQQPTINNQYKDKDNDKRWQQGRRKRTSDDKEDDQGQEEGMYVRQSWEQWGNTRDMQQSLHGMQQWREMQRGQGKMRMNYIRLWIFSHDVFI
jgi:hypothetical protein